MFMGIIKHTVPLFLGGLAGYAVYKFIGCRSGVCPITNNPYMSIGYGVLMALILTK